MSVDEMNTFALGDEPRPTTASLTGGIAGSLIGLIAGLLVLAGGENAAMSAVPLLAFVLAPLGAAVGVTIGAMRERW